MYTDEMSLGRKAQAHYVEGGIARRLKDFDDEELQKIVDGSKHTRFDKFLRVISRTVLSEGMIAEGIIRFREDGRRRGYNEKEISNLYDILLVSGKICQYF